MLEFYLYKKRMKKKGYNIHKVDKTVIEYFKIITKNHKNLEEIEVIKRLNRDFYCGQVVKINENFKTSVYGALSITLNVNTNTIIGISNGIHFRKDINKFMKQRLTTTFEVGE